MTYPTKFLAASILGIASLTACSGGEPLPKEDVSAEISALSQLSGTSRNVGTLESGRVKSVSYTSTPKYRAITINAKAGDAIDALVSSSDGDALAWLTDDKRNVLYFNDDASNTTYDARLKYTLPASAYAGEYTIYLREYNYDPSSFKVTLSITSAAPKPECTVDAECKLPSSADATDVAQCSAAGKCETVDVADVRCAGSSKNPHTCPSGFRCTGTSSSTGACVATCQYNGTPHDVGSSFSAVDGCNSCTCTAGDNGTVAVSCTANVCTCDPSNEPNRRYIGTPSTCPLIRFMCISTEHSFFNSCGCGCETN